MKNLSHAQSLRRLFDRLETATLAGDGDVNLVSIARKRADCVSDTFGGTRCG